MIISAFSEAISIGAVLPFIGVLTAPSRIFEHSIAQPFIHALEITSADQLILPLAVLFGVTALLAGGLRLLFLWLSVRLTFAVGVDLSSEIYRRTLYQPYDVHIKRNSSEVISSITAKIGQSIFYIIMPLLTLISATIMFIAISVAIVFMTPTIVLGAFSGIGLLYIIIIRGTRKHLNSDSQKISDESNQVIKCLQEGLGGVRDILIDGTQETFCASYKKSERILRRAQGNNQIISQGPRYIMEALAMVLMAILAFWFSQQLGGIETAVPILATMALGMQRLLPALQQIYAAWSNIRGYLSSLQDSLDMLDQPLPDFSRKTDVKELNFQSSIRLKDISFRYAPKTTQVLNNVNLIIDKGSRIGFVGETGSGKSTLLDIIMGLLQPSEGIIEIDGLPVTSKNQHRWQSHIAHVPQVIFLADASIEENIAFGIEKKQIDHALVRQAAQQAQIAETIEAWPKKYKTSVGEQGVQLSGGQRQRIGIARALYKQADVIIFDEATSALDISTEESVIQAIESLNDELTILIIAHRLTTLRSCDEIIELRNGSVFKKEIPVNE